VHSKSTRRISDSVYSILIEDIRDLRLLPGQAISETAIAEWLNVSRSPVREAITRGVDLGLIIVLPQVGSYIAPISVREVQDAAFIRGALEVSAFKLAIRDGVPDTTEIQRLVDLNAEAATTRNFDVFFDTDEKLHENVFELAGRGRIWELVRRSKIQLDRVRHLSFPLSVLDRNVTDEHQRLVDCLRSRDEKAGVAVIESHARRVLLGLDEHRALYPDYFIE
jgi:GntR family transcriptional regulator, rspAB operon transcriptional repressor